MHHTLRIDLADGPEVGGVGWSEELVGGAQLPAIETPLVGTHEILARQHRVLLVPDNGLAEIEVVGLEDRRIVATVGIPTPNVEASAWLQNPGQIAEPSLQQ